LLLRDDLRISGYSEEHAWHSSASRFKTAVSWHLPSLQSEELDGGAGAWPVIMNTAEAESKQSLKRDGTRPRNTSILS
jgi:hypothetical protein